MGLFETQDQLNLLPFDGEVKYYAGIFKTTHAEVYFDKLSTTIDWKQDELIMFGKPLTTKRKVAWYGKDRYAYSYSNTTKLAIPFTPELEEILGITESATGARFNSCLLNMYNDGSEGMGWHSDDEKTLKLHSPIASVSFGAGRRFLFRHRQTKQTIETWLEAGSILLMSGTTQTNWLHSLPKSARIKKPRINLTFRTFNQ